jgi:DedD protein
LAALLAAIAVLFLPSFFKDRQQYQVDTSSHIPGRPTITAVDFNEPSQPENIEPASTPETMFLSEESEQIPVDELQIPPAEPTRILSEPQISASSLSLSSVGSAPVVKLNNSGLPEAWVIQVASLSSLESANKLRDQLQVDGHKAYVRSASSANTVIHRVFIGPKQDKAEVLAIKSELDKRLKVNSLILPFKP